MHSISAPAARQWHHVVWTSDGSNGVMYVDGVQVDADAIAPQTGTVGLIYLSTYDQADNDFIGKLDDVRIYNRAITAAEVTRIYDESAGTRLNANTSSGSLNSGLISYWSFNGTDITSDLVRDSSGLNNHGGFIGGSTSTAKVIGKIGQALRFDGVNDHVVTVMGNSIKGLSQASISAWFKADALTGATQILYEEAINASTNSRFSLRIHTTNRIRFFGRAPDAAGGTTWVDSTTDLVPGEWYHVVGIFNADSDIQTIVLNGVAQTASVSEDAFDATDPNQIPRIGSRPGSEPFRGIIDEVRLYNRALSVEEAKRLYNIGR